MKITRILILSAIFILSAKVCAQSGMDDLAVDKLRAQVVNMPQSGSSGSMERRQSLLDVADRLTQAAREIESRKHEMTPAEKTLSNAELLVAIIKLQDAISDPVGGKSDIFARAISGVRRVERSIRAYSGGKVRVPKIILNSSKLKSSPTSFYVYVLPVSLVDYIARIPNSVLLNVLRELSFHGNSEKGLDEGGEFALWIGSCCSVERFSDYIKSKKLKNEILPEYQVVTPNLQSPVELFFEDRHLINF